MTATSVGQVLDALVALWIAAAPTGWQVLDSGPPIDPGLDFLCVGYDRSGEPAVVVNCSDAKAGALQNRESYDVSNLLSLWNGKDSPSQVRTSLLAAFTAFRGAVRANRKLGGLVTDMTVTEYEMDQDVSTLGNVASIRFTVHIDTF